MTEAIKVNVKGYDYFVSTNADGSVLIKSPGRSEFKISQKDNVVTLAGKCFISNKATKDKKTYKNARDAAFAVKYMKNNFVEFFKSA